jgi:serine acetyltransferase
MAPTHPTSLRELAQWMAEDAAVNRRHGGVLSVVAVLIFRLNQFGVRNRGLVPLVVRLLSLPLVAFARIGLSNEISGRLACGRRLILPHGGRNVIINPETVVGNDVSFASGSGAGMAYPTPGAPTIGDRVYIGANSSIVGDITIGEGAFIGAHALVVRPVQAGKLAIGVPARVVGDAPVRA